TLEMASAMASKSPLTLKVAKQALRASERMSIEEGLLYERDLFCLCFSTEDMKEGVQAFLEKRDPEWTGR
ncbi:MAG: enoyl-CoA hydratase-related protein, partial [Thermoanaerobaculia bacterium]|nr:enoyl-CoA hydratase-related protein [Thermoanaerobaculia bacterium]